MCSRLMFSSSIVTRPEILIVDEILGVGDAYFAHKSFERMRQLCAQRGHDAAAGHPRHLRGAESLRPLRLARSRRGEVRRRRQVGDLALRELGQGPGRAPSSAAQHRGAGTGRATTAIVHVLIRSRTGFSPDRPLALGIDRTAAERRPNEQPRRSPTVRRAGRSCPRAISGVPRRVGGERCRVLRDTGSIYHKAEWIVDAAAAGRGDRRSGPVPVRRHRPDRRPRLHAGSHAGRRR